MMRDLRMDLKYALRTLTTKPAYAAVAVIVLALGIGANTALFSILYAVLWKPFPYHDPEKLVMVWEADYSRGELQNVANPANFFDWKTQNKVFTDMAYFVGGNTNLNAEDRPEEISMQYVSSNFFSLLGSRPLLGRTFVSSDDSHEERIIVISHGLWRRRFGEKKDVIGKKVFLNGRAATIIGVMPENFRWHFKQGSLTGKPPEFWSRWTIPAEERVRGGRYLSVVARLKSEVSPQQALTQMRVLSKQLEKRYYDFNAGWSSNVIPLREQLAGDLRKPLFILSGAVALVLLIACTNVANLMLSRAVSRAREISIRAALGAGRVRIIRQLLTESVLLSLLGGVAGILIAVWGLNGLALLGIRAGIEIGTVQVNWQMLFFTLLLSLVTGLFFGMVPAFAISRSNLNEQLKEGSRGSTGESGKIRSLLVVSQLAITLVLLTGAALLIQSYGRLASIDPGFKDADKVLTFRVLLPSVKYPEDTHKIDWFRNLVERLRSAPGAKSVGMVNFLPFAGPSAGTGFHIAGKPKPLPDREPVTKVFVGDEGYFHTLQIPLKRGRFFSQEETVQRRKVVLVNEELVKRYFPNEDPIGKQITIFMKDENEPSLIIGIVGNVKHGTIEEEADPSVYWPYAELTYNFMNLLVRTEQDPKEFVSSAMAIVRGLDRELPLADVRTLQEWVGDSTARARFHMTLLVLLAVTALVLALAGVYGVISYSVLQRTQEMGIRMALGASGKDIFRLILKHGSRLIGLGIAIGLAVSFATTRLMQTMLYETSSSDPIIFVAAILFLVLVALVACCIPSLRAAKVDPLVALRYE